MNLEEFKKWVETEKAEARREQRSMEEAYGFNTRAEAYARAKYQTFNEVHEKLKEVEV